MISNISLSTYNIEFLNRWLLWTHKKLA